MNREKQRDKILALLSHNLTKVYGDQLKEVESKYKEPVGLAVINYVNMNKSDYEEFADYCFTILFAMPKVGSLTEGFCFDLRDLLNQGSIRLNEPEKTLLPIPISESRWNNLIDAGFGRDLNLVSKNKGILLFPLSTPEILLITENIHDSITVALGASLFGGPKLLAAKQINKSIKVYERFSDGSEGFSTISPIKNKKKTTLQKTLANKTGITTKDLDMLVKDITISIKNLLPDTDISLLEQRLQQTEQRDFIKQQKDSGVTKDQLVSFIFDAFVASLVDTSIAVQ